MLTFCRKGQRLRFAVGFPVMRACRQGKTTFNAFSRRQLLVHRPDFPFIELAGKYPRVAARAGKRRRLLFLARSGEGNTLAAALAAEEERERERDRIYWEPLRKELEELRHRATGKRASILNL